MKIDAEILIEVYRVLYDDYLSKLIFIDLLANFHLQSSSSSPNTQYILQIFTSIIISKVLSYKFKNINPYVKCH